MKKKCKFSKIAVIVILSQVFVYTWAQLIFSFFVGTELAPTTSIAFYSFCGAEAGMLAFIKKLESEEKKNETEDNSEADKS